MSSPITTHVLNTTSGTPAVGLSIYLEKQNTVGEWETLAQGITNNDGRITNLLTPENFTKGKYCLIFETEKYFTKLNISTFFPSVTIIFEITNLTQHYHIPLLLSPFSYSTYRGS